MCHQCDLEGHVTYVLAVIFPCINCCVTTSFIFESQSKTSLFLTVMQLLKRIIAVGVVTQRFAMTFVAAFRPKQRCGISEGRCDPVKNFITISLGQKRKKRKQKTFTHNSRYSLMVTHLTTNLPIWCLSMAERTGCPVLTSLWSYVLVAQFKQNIYRVVRVLFGVVGLRYLLYFWLFCGF